MPSAPAPNIQLDCLRVSQEIELRVAEVRYRENFVALIFEYDLAGFERLGHSPIESQFEGSDSSIK